MTDVDDFTKEAECTYKNESYSVRDNGAVLRHPKQGGRVRPSDNQWTFGKPNDKHGYMEFGTARVHIIVATAFYGEKSTKIYVVDHKDGNRRNNRVENLRWLTRLENVLANPITRKNIEFICGCSAEDFLACPEKYRDKFQEGTSYAWMRTVSAEEGAECLKNRLAWAESDKQPSGGSLGEWVYQSSSTSANSVEAFPPEPCYIPSLTPGAVQRKWRTPSEFPSRPEQYNEPLKDYYNSLKPGSIFCRNDLYEFLVLEAALSDDGNSLFVMTQSAQPTLKKWALAEITFEDGLFVHTSIQNFFTQEGALKQFTISQGLEWTGGDSIDDYC